MASFGPSFLTAVLHTVFLCVSVLIVLTNAYCQSFLICLSVYSLNIFTVFQFLCP